MRFLARTSYNSHLCGKHPNSPCPRFLEAALHHLVWELEKVIVDEDNLVVESVDEENLWAGWEMNLHRRIDPMHS